MKKHSFKIDIYDWKVYYIEVEKKKDAKEVEKFCKKLNIDSDTIIKNIKNGYIDGGCHIYNERWSVIFLYMMTSKNKKIEILVHETTHAADRIKRYCELKGTESRAFLTGFITKKLLKNI